jgi:hypothetical protein
MLAVCSDIGAVYLDELMTDAVWMESPTRFDSIPLSHDSYYRGRTETLNIKMGLSIGAVTMSSSLRDELPNFARRKMIGGLLRRRALSIGLMESFLS